MKYIEIEIDLIDNDQYEKFERLGMTRPEGTLTPVKVLVHHIVAFSEIDKNSTDIWVGTFEGATRVQLSEAELIHRMKNAKEL